MNVLHVYRLGRVEYEDGLALMDRFGQARLQGLVPDTLLLLEHPPVLTLGRAAKRENILANDETLAQQGVSLHETNRGGDVTYHGPGQIVGYPIFLLPPERQDVRRYVCDVEKSIIRVLASHGITARGIPKWRGVWVGEETDPDVRKIAAIGVHLARWITSHGFALNVNTQLEHFRWIIPCGIREAGVTSMARELERPLDAGEVEQALGESFALSFGASAQFQTVTTRTVSVAAWREGTSGPEVLLLKRTEARGGFWQIVTGRIAQGEGAREAAQRELLEETGASAPVTDLSYKHAFCFGKALPPQLIEEQGFGARVPHDFQVRLAPSEHEAFRWAPVEAALAELPFAGLRETVRRAVAHR